MLTNKEFIVEMTSQDEANQHAFQLKLQQFLDHSQISFERLPVIKREFDGIDRFNQSDLYIETLREVEKIVSNLTKNLRYIEQFYSQLNENERVKLDQQIQLLRDEIDRGMSELERLREQGTTEENNSSIDETNHVEEDETSNVLRQRDVTDNPLNHTYDLLERDLAFLRDRIDEVATMVAEQEVKLSRLELYKTIAHNRLHTASSFLHNAIRNPFVTTASGAVIGASVGGPVGFMMGTKVGSLVALSGSALGALSMNIMRQRVTQNNETENNTTAAYSQAML